MLVDQLIFLAQLKDGSFFFRCIQPSGHIRPDWGARAPLGRPTINSGKYNGCWTINYTQRAHVPRLCYMIYVGIQVLSLWVRWGLSI